VFVEMSPPPRPTETPLTENVPLPMVAPENEGLSPVPNPSAVLCAAAELPAYVQPAVDA
jgi:hypothetical protein